MPKMRAQHQSHSRCRNCDLVFHSCHLLNLHREAASHWTDDEYKHNSEADEEEAEYNMEGWEELERLL